MKKLDSIQTKLINTNLDKNGNLPCIKAFKVASLIGVRPSKMAEITQSLNIKITNCQLGTFGKLKFSSKTGNDYIKNNLKSNTKDNEKVECEIAWCIAKEQGISLNKVGSSIRNSNLKVSHCQLGLFYDEEFNDFEKPRKQNY